MERFYFDHNATTPVPDEVLSLFSAVLRENYGNASSIHYFGQEAKSRLERARQQVAWLLCCEPKEIVFLSGGTEASNLAVLGTLRRGGAAGKHVVTSSIEHPAVVTACEQAEREGAEVTWLRVGAAGAVDPDDVRAALRKQTALIAVMHANNETGVVQPIEEIAGIAREAGVRFHCDGVQATGKLPLDKAPPVSDFYALSGHKFYAPKGVGALYVRQGMELEAIIHGGRQERGRRPGTQNVPAAAALGAAARMVRKGIGKESQRLSELRDRLERGILDRVPNTGVNGGGPRVPNTTNICFDGVGAEAMVISLDLRGFAVATGSACSSGAVEPSHVLMAMGLSSERARSSVRFSLGMANTARQVEALIDAVVDAVTHLRKVAPPREGPWQIR